MACQVVTLRDIAPYKPLKRCTTHGVAWIEDGSTGTAVSVHPNSRRGMAGYERPVTCHGWTFDTASLATTFGGPGMATELEEIVRQACRCGGVHNRDDDPRPVRLQALFKLGGAR